MPVERRAETVGHGGEGRGRRSAPLVVVAVVAAFAAGVVAGAPRLRPERGAPSAFRVYERDGALPGPGRLTLEGWEVRQHDAAATGACLLAQPVQRANVFDDRLAGAVVSSGYPRRVKPDPQGRHAATVTCTDAAGSIVAVFGVKPRAYVSDLSTGQPGAAVSEVPLPQRDLDALAALAAAAAPLVGETVIYLVRSPLRFEARADADAGGNLVLPAELVGPSSHAATVVFHGLVRKGLDQFAGARFESAFGGDVERDFARLGDGSKSALAVGSYLAGAVDLDEHAADYVASALTVWKFHQDAYQRRLRALPPDERVAASRFLRTAVASLVGRDPDRQAALESLAPGTRGLLGSA